MAAEFLNISPPEVMDSSWGKQETSQGAQKGKMRKETFTGG